MGYSIDSITADCYEGTTCLINKFGITDEQQLVQIEGQITFAKGSELECQPIQGDFDFTHYKAIHKFLFEDIYEWAGEIRRVDISNIDTNELMTATIHAAGGVEVYLKQLFTEAIITV